MDNLTDIWNNRKTRGIIFLVFYVILFSYIFIVYGNKSEKIILPDNKPQKVDKQDLSKYEYQYIREDDVVDIVRNNDVLKFNYLDNEYYYINNKYYRLENEKLVETEEPLKYNFDYLNNIEEIKKISALVKTTKYASGDEEENYDVNLSQLLNIFGIQEEVDAKEMTNYSLIYTGNQLKEIVFYNFNFKIKYIKFTDVQEINVNYEFYHNEVETES